MKVLNLVQGSDEWNATRLNYRTASEASAMMSATKKATRNELLRMKATGDVKEFSRWVKEVLFAKGHEVEAAARPIAEKIIGEELFPATAVNDDEYLLSSFDGITMMENVCWECKQWNELKAEVVQDNKVPEEDYWQVVQQLIVSGADKLLYMVTDGTEEKTVYTWFKLKKTDIKKLMAGWKQFDEDLDNYEYVPEAMPVVADQIESLPSLVVRVTGEVTESNIELYRDQVISFIRSINTDLQTDQDFVNASEMVKFCKKLENKLVAVKQQALSQTQSIEALFNTINLFFEETRKKRLTLNTLVDNRKKAIRHEILNRGETALTSHLKKVNDTLNGVSLPEYTVDFASVMKGRNKIDKLNDAVDDALAKAKIDINEMADEIRINLQTYEELATGYEYLFNLQSIITKPSDDFTAHIKSMIADHKAAEEERLETERKRIREEEEQKARDKLAEEQKAKEAEEQKAKEAEAVLTAPTVKTEPEVKPRRYDFDGQSGRYGGGYPAAKEPVDTVSPSTPSPTTDFQSPSKPSDREIIEVLSLHYRVHESTVIQWLVDIDLNKASEALVSNF
ncbi:MAG: YqaJ viral recombinase family protein [Candidatus Thiodiazotropha sp. (ex Troendleina suluensis)]|nr:YqaJ viral recombinase family protein [Candidatus Thiodiazotropha sp. (ex Troendleina suluensis)]